MAGSRVAAVSTALDGTAGIKTPIIEAFASVVDASVLCIEIFQ